MEYKPGTARAAENVIAVHALVLDVDEAKGSTPKNSIPLTTAGLAEILQTIEQRGYRALVHASHSDKPDARRVRIVLELAEPVPGDQWKAFWIAAVADLGIHVDKSTKDCSRLFFMPSRPNDADYTFGGQAGKPYNVHVVAPSEPVANVAGERPNIPAADVRARAAAHLADHWPANGRHYAFMALAGALASEGWEEDEITAFTVMVARLMPGCDQKAIDDRAKHAHEACELVDNDQPVSGWSHLIKDHGIEESVILSTRSRLGLVPEFDIGTTDARGALELGALSFLDTVAPPEAKPSRYIGELALIELPPVVSYPTNVAELNRLLGGGLSTQQMTAILGKPGAGKSALVISWALGFESVVPVLYATTELGINEVVARFAAPELGVPWRNLVRGNAKHADGSPVTHAQVAAVLKNKRIAIIGQEEIYKAGEKSVELIARTALEMKEQWGIAPIILVDYMQELARGDASEIRSKVTKVAVAFRQVAQALDCAVGLVSSVNRKGYNQEAIALRQGNDPTAYMALAKESGDVDYAAATVIFVDVASEIDELGWKAGQIVVAKSRHGEVGYAGVRFKGATGQWEDWAPGVEEMSPERRAERKQESKFDQVETALIAKITELATYAKDENDRSSLLGKGELANTPIGTGSTKEKSDTIKRLLATGKLIEIKEHYFNPGTKTRTSRDVVVLGATLAAGLGPVRTAEPPLDVASALAGIVGGSRT